MYKCIPRSFFRNCSILNVFNMYKKNRDIQYESKLIKTLKNKNNLI